MKKIISIPNASRTFEALRNLGYDLNSSVADLVDNSITPKVHSDNIRIILKREKNGFKLNVIDDGIGMIDTELEEAMRLGSNAKYKLGDLGKFGMGMKTASLSHCNILTVISKKRNHHITGFQWDLNHVKHSDDGWVLFQLTDSEIAEVLKKENIHLGNNGTAVIWNDIFRLDSDYNAYSNERFATNYIFKIEEQLKLHLSMVFHRFLEKRELAIFVNNDSLKPWDPFWKKEKNTNEVILRENQSQFKIKEGLVPVKIKAFILPNKESFSNEENWKEAKGLLSWNEAQGYYIYRANRIIRFGGWQGTRALDEHDKLARVSIDIDENLDKYFQITVNKAKIEFPDSLFNHLKNNVNHLVSKHAQNTYRPRKEKFNNKFRKQEQQLNGIKRSFVTENGIKTNQGTNSNDINVSNPNGNWIANKVSEFFKLGANKDFEVISGNVEQGHLWKVVCNLHEKIKVVVNQNHPFYHKFYDSTKNKNVTNAIDALLLSLAFGELCSRNDQNSYVFDMYKTACSNALEKITNEKIV